MDDVSKHARHFLEAAETVTCLRIVDCLDAGQGCGGDLGLVCRNTLHTRLHESCVTEYFSIQESLKVHEI